jgi:integrase
VARRLTKQRIDELKPKPGQQYVEWDTTVRGFGVRVSPAGAKAYILRYRTKAGRVRWRSYGRVDGDLSLEQARDLAEGDRGIVAAGGDPMREIDAAKKAETVATVGERFLADLATRPKPAKPPTIRLYRLAFDQHIRPILGSVPITEVSDEDAARVHRRLKATPYMGNRVLAVLSSLLAYSMTQRYRPKGPNPCKGLPKYAEHKRKRYLDASEYARLGKVLRAARKQGTVASAALTAIELLLLTGCRPTEIATLKWAHVNVARGVLELPDTKTGERTIYLSPAAVRLLKKWPRFDKAVYVFPGTGRRTLGEHIHASTLAHTWATIREAAKIADVRLYDACRHSFASQAITMHGLSLAQIGEQLGHSQPATTARYAHLHDDAAKANAAVIGGGIATALGRRVRR